MSTITTASPRKSAKVIIAILIAFFVTYYIALILDHLYMVNGRHYPLALAERITVASDSDRGISGLTDICQGKGGWNFYNRDNGNFMRCTTILSGSLTWPKTYLIENYAQLADETP